MLHSRQALLSFALALGLAPVALAVQSGGIDIAFQVGTGFDGQPWCVEIDAQGRILVGGDFQLYNGTPRVRIARLGSNGQIDPTFNPGVGPDNVVRDIEEQPNGKLLIVGSFSTYQNVPCPGIARLMPNGSIDTTFQPVVVQTVPPIYALELQPDGSPVLGGAFNRFGGVLHERLVRLDSVGGLDATFNPAANNAVYALALQPDGSILVGGIFTSLSGVSRQRIGRFEPTGALDTSFVGLANDEVDSIALQPDGKVVIGGLFTSYGGAPANRIARLASNGQLDPTFQSNLGANGPVRSVVIHGNGGVLIGGEFTQVAGVHRSRLARLMPNGTLDNSFNPFPGPDGTVLDIADHGPARAVIVGTFTFYNSAPSRGIARLVTGGLCYIDADGDGFGAGVGILTTGVCGAGYSSVNGDCNDSNPGIFPGAPELCDGLDNDCDVTIDEGLVTVWYPDVDGDGYGNTAQVLQTCNPPAGYVIAGGDCDDTNPVVHPNAQELCDGLDNDCDGVTDEVFVESYCTPGVSFDGCVATLSGVGVPSVSNGSGFQLSASGVPGQRFGLFYYGFQPDFVAVSTNSSSTFCVRSPTQRMTTLLSSGTVAQCNGVLSIDFNQWLQAHPAALGSPMLPGTVIYAQAWYRDSHAPDRANLSDGLKFTICN
ncbi:MAG: MopE-related protein [Planctomycetota bacterium]|nr:MopE-related protein [Planctomycetota bacterium]